MNRLVRSVAGATLVMAAATAFASAWSCSGGDASDPSTADAASGPLCTALGDPCSQATDPCCWDNGMETKCMDSTCQVCAATGADCATDDDCCVNRNCRSGTCCNRPRTGCTVDDDCCSGTCSNRSCCLPTGVTTHSILDCCSGQSRDIYFEYDGDGTEYHSDGPNRYYAFSQCT